MADASLSSLGAKVVVVTSCDENHPPESIIDGTTKTFWMSTGMFPQEFIVRFAEATKVSAVTVDSYNEPDLWTNHPLSHSTSMACDSTTFKHLKIEKNMFQNASKFEFVAEKEFEHTEGHLQSNAISLNGSNATHLRFIITSGYDHFVSVHRVSVQN